MTYVLTGNGGKCINKSEAEQIIMEEIKEQFKDEAPSELIELIVHTAPLDLLISYQQNKGKGKIRKLNTFRGARGG